MWGKKKGITKINIDIDYIIMCDVTVTDCVV